MSEARILREVHLAAGGLPGVRLFRNQVGQGVAGNVVDRLAPDLLVVRGRPVTMGLCAGSPDLIGWRVLTVTPEMIGQQVAQFVGLEVKTETGRVSDDQRRFLAVLTDHGGLAAVVRSADDARKLVDMPGSPPEATGRPKASSQHPRGGKHKQGFHGPEIASEEPSR